MSTEPVRLASLITAALTATIALLAFFGVPSLVVGGITAAVSAWVVVIFELVRSKVTPVPPADPEV